MNLFPFLLGPSKTVQSSGFGFLERMKSMPRTCLPITRKKVCYTHQMARWLLTVAPATKFKTEHLTSVPHEKSDTILALAYEHIQSK